MKPIILVLILSICVSSFAFSDEKCALVRVIDGDTIVCDINGWSEIIGNNISVRMRGCDSPEIRTSDVDEKKLGYYAKDLLIAKLGNKKQLTLKNIGKGKYFRLVADIYSGNEKISCYSNKLSYSTPSYKCGTKTTCSQMSSCDEALFYFKSCDLGKLDKDQDGIPCESICN